MRTRSMNIALTLTASLIAAGLATPGCEIDPEPDATTDGGDTDTNGGDDGDTVMPPDGDPYFFVRVDDLSPMADTADGGSDIDAIILDKTDGTQAFADSVEGYEHGGGDGITGDELDPTEALGSPDAFYAYPDTSVCDVEGTGGNAPFVSLGGTGGVLVVGMSAAIETGDTLTVLEVGGCDFGDGMANAEEVDVSISTAKEIDGTWTFLGNGTGPEITATVPELE